MAPLTTTLAALAALFSAACAVLSYRLARSIYNEAKSDDRVVVGKLSYPELRERSHAMCVIQCPLFNKSKRKGYVDRVSVFNRKGEPVAVAWSGEIDHLGMPQRPSGILGIVDSATLYIRRDDGREFDYARILFSHSFSESRLVVVFDPVAEFVRTAE